MPAAAVRTYERNFTARVSGNGGVWASIAIPAKKGPIMSPTLVSGEKDLLEIFTPNKTIGVGFNMAYFSALAYLQKGNSLWVTRVAPEAEMGGILFYDESKPSAYTQVNEISPELPEITFSVSNIVDGSDTVTISNLVGGVQSDLVGRVINIDDVVGSFSVVSETASELTLDNPVTSSISFNGSGTGNISETTNFVGFNIDVGTGNSLDIDISNLTSGLPTDLLNKSISLMIDGVKVIRTVVSVSNSTLTLDSVTPSATSPNGNGYTGLPAVTMTVSGIMDGGTTVSLSNISPSYITIDDIDGQILNITSDMSDNSNLILSSVVSNPNGSSMTFDDGINNPSLVDTSSATAPYTEAVANGFEDNTAIVQTDSLFALTSADGGEWIKDYRVSILTNFIDVREFNAFTIQVFHKNNLNLPLETFTVCREEGRKDGFGRNMYIDDVLESSRLIRGFNNILMDKDLQPVESVVRDQDNYVTSRSFIQFLAGDDGQAVTDADMISAADLMNNKNNYPVTLFMDGGWTTPSYQKRLAEICEIRDDSVALLSVPYSVESKPNPAKEIVDYRNLVLNVNSSYTALYSCHLNITDKYNDRNIFVSPDGYAAAAIVESQGNYEIWYPPAGFKRGKMFVNDTLIRFTDGELDLLSKNAINPNRFAPGKGIAIWGQYTLGLTPSSLDRLNVRLLLNEIKPAISTFLEHFLFDLNTVGVRDLVVATVENYLSNIQSRNGVYGYKVVCDETNNSDFDLDNHTLNLDVFIKPTQSIEYINFTTILSSTGIEFENIG